MVARPVAGLASLPCQRNETGLGVCVAFINGRGNLCDDSDRIRPGPFASLWPRIKRDGPGDRDHARNCRDRFVGGQNLVLAMGTFSPSPLGNGPSVGCRSWSAFVELRRDRQSNREGGAFASPFAWSTDAAAVHFDDRLTDGLTETETFPSHFELLE